VKRTDRPLVIFDLDETLIHATANKLAVQEDGKFGALYLYRRPFLQEFLAACATQYTLAIWSSAADDYVSAVVQQLITSEVQFAFVWGRSECWLKTVKQPLGDPRNGMFRKEHRYIKPLEKLTRKGYKMRQLLIVDDSLSKVEDNPGNFVIVPMYEGSLQDDVLLKLGTWLLENAAEEDFRLLPRPFD
jgi:RNA polymerase II subunit A small phosphatase-like protein